MKKITLFILLFSLFNYTYSQCPPNSAENISVASINDGFVQILASDVELQPTSEYVTVTGLIIGHNYRFISTHGDPAVNDYITITDASNAVKENSPSPMVVNNIQYSTLRIHVRVDEACTTDSFFHKLTLVDLTVAPTTCQKPTVSTTATLTYRSDKRMDITWYAPEYSTPEGYEWMFIPQGGGTSFSGSTVSPNTSISTGDVLMPNTTYNISIRSTCGVNGVSDYTTFSIPTNANPPPANDFCSGAINLIEQTSISDASFASSTPGTLLGGAGTDVVAESCGGSTGNARDDVWYKFVAKTSNGHITVEPNSSFDVVVTLYSGDCNALTFLACSDVYINSLLPEEIDFTGLTIGETYYTRTYFYGPTTPATPTFDIKIWSTTPATDNDNDGYVDSVDCDDNDADEFPGQTWYIDSDADGYGDGTSTVACERPTNYYTSSELTQTDGDCDDTNLSTNPGATEIWYDGVDQNCDGQSDYDQDGDGYDSESFGGNDCDDTKFDVNPGQTEIEGNGLDDDCNPSTPDIPLGIEEFEKYGFSYYPNPVRSSLILKAKINIDKVDVYNLLGQEIIKFYPNNMESIVDMTSLQNGLYFLKVIINNSSKTIQIIKQ